MATKAPPTAAQRRGLAANQVRTRIDRAAAARTTAAAIQAAMTTPYDGNQTWVSIHDAPATTAECPSTTR